MDDLFLRDLRLEDGGELVDGLKRPHEQRALGQGTGVLGA